MNIPENAVSARPVKIAEGDFHYETGITSPSNEVLKFIIAGLKIVPIETGFFGIDFYDKGKDLLDTWKVSEGGYKALHEYAKNLQPDEA